LLVQVELLQAIKVAREVMEVIHNLELSLQLAVVVVVLHGMRQALYVVGATIQETLVDLVVAEVITDGIMVALEH
jgi:hypothetical protein